MIVSTSMAEIMAVAAQQPEGYVEYLLSRAKIEADTVTLDEAAQDDIREKYPFLGQGGVFSQAMLKAGEPYQPAGYVEFLLSRGKIKGDFVILDCKTQHEFNQKFPAGTRAHVHRLSDIEAHFHNKPKGMLEFVLSQGKVAGNFLILSPQAYKKKSAHNILRHRIGDLQHQQPQGFRTRKARRLC